MTWSSANFMYVLPIVELTADSQSVQFELCGECKCHRIQSLNKHWMYKLKRVSRLEWWWCLGASLDASLFSFITNCNTHTKFMKEQKKMCNILTHPLKYIQNTFTALYKLTHQFWSAYFFYTFFFIREEIHYHTFAFTLPFQLELISKMR